MMTNKQTPEPRAINSTGLLDIHSVFKTIQGEGPFSGHPAIFIRLAGCNIQCPGCDTEYTATRAAMSPRDLLNKVTELDQDDSVKLIVVTGGEPFRQNIFPLCEALEDWSYQIQIETNGTLPPPENFEQLKHTAVVCSPKAPKVNPKLHPFISAYKYVLQKGNAADEDGLPLSVLNNPFPPSRPHPGYLGPVFVQPMDEGDPERNRENAEYAAEKCIEYGYTFQLQIHKLVGLP